MRARWLTLVAALAGLALVGCRSARVFDWEPRPGVYDRLAPADYERMRAARRSIALGDPYTARDILTGLSTRLPENLAVGVFLQDVRLAEIDRLEGPAAERRAEELLFEYRRRAETEPTVPNLVLAARVEPDGPTADRWLREASQRDPACAWSWYGLAHQRAAAREFDAARDALALAFEADPGHLQARRLETILLARAGRASTAERALSRWIEFAYGDPRVDPREVARARLDLATLHAWAGRSDAARRELDRAAPLDGIDQARRSLIAAVVAESERDPERALVDARRAAELAPDDPLPLVQVALLCEYSVDDPAGALEAWRGVTARLEARDPRESSTGELDWLRVGIQARVQTERLERALGLAPGAPLP